MCFFDQQIYQCGDFKWGAFRQHCAKEYRTGETCGMKLVMQNIQVQTKCRNCDKIELKRQRWAAELDRIRRLQQEGRRNLASIKNLRDAIQFLKAEIKEAACKQARMFDIAVLRSMASEMEEMDKLLEMEYASLQQEQRENLASIKKSRDEIQSLNTAGLRSIASEVEEMVLEKESASAAASSLQHVQNTPR
jgi:hypothetical protein